MRISVNSRPALFAYVSSHIGSPLRAASSCSRRSTTVVRDFGRSDPPPVSIGSLVTTPPQGQADAIRQPLPPRRLVA
jgi:hypothetical protein